MEEKAILETTRAVEDMKLHMTKIQLGREADRNVLRFQLNSGQRIPLLGLGLYKPDDPSKVEEAVTTAIIHGIRHFDCAWIYNCEEEIGRAIKEHISAETITREQLFITTKLWNTCHSREKVIQSLRTSLEKLQLDYVDMFVMNFPMGITTGDEDDEGLYMKYKKVIEETREKTPEKTLEKTPDESPHKTPEKKPQNCPLLRQLLASPPKRSYCNGQPLTTSPEKRLKHDQAGPSNPEQPELSSPEQPGSSSPEQPGSSSPEQPGPSSPEQPGPSNPEQPGPSRRPEPEHSNYSDIDYLETWAAMEECVKLGLTKSIGVANFNKLQIERLIQNSTIRPAVLQTEIHPYFYPTKLIRYCADMGIHVQALFPFGVSDISIGEGKVYEATFTVNNEDLELSVNAYEPYKGKGTLGRLVLNWLIKDKHLGAVPKALTETRIQEFIHSFDFEIAQTHVDYLNSLNANERFFPGSMYSDHPYYPFDDE